MRLIVKIHDDIDPSIAFSCIASVISWGRISDNGKAYCYASRFHGNIIVYAKLNKKSDTFIVMREKE